MEENKSIFSYITQLFATYGLIVVIFMIFGIVIGDLASEHSTLFSMKNAGFSISTLAQLFLLALVITVTQIVFLTDKWIKNMSMVIRYTLFFGIIVAMMILFSIVFAWFPINQVEAWIGFLISFLICTVISIAMTNLVEKAENKKMEQALKKLQKDE